MCTFITLTFFYVYTCGPCILCDLPEVVQRQGACALHNITTCNRTAQTIGYFGKLRRKWAVITHASKAILYVIRHDLKLHISL